jgi:glyoxylase-like metal-dependent hydrolase (beta-lactamase superfamily II)
MSWFQLGDVQIAQIVESEDPFKMPAEMFPNIPEDELLAAVRLLPANALCQLTGKLILPVQSFVVRTKWHTILIDTCVGNHKSFKLHPPWHNMTSNRYMTGMRALGIGPEDIDFVFCTHLHFDHTGWNTIRADGQWTPTFPNAKYMFSKSEVAWCEQMGIKDNDPTYVENVRPIIEARRADLISTDFSLDDNIILEHTPGHTPHHVAVHVRTPAGQGVVTGDILQCLLQCNQPDWNSRYDVDGATAMQTRRRVLEECVEKQRLLMSCHFPLPTIGRVKAKGRGFDFEFWRP